MARLAPAALEFRIVAAATLVVGCGRAAGILEEGDRSDLRAAGLGLGACLLGLWGLWAARAVRTAIRLALPARPRGTRERTAATVARVAAAQVIPVCALAIAGGALAAHRVDGARAAGAGALVGVGLTALLAARRVTGAERRLGRRLLREPHWGVPLGRRSLFLEPQALFAPPAGPPAAPWPAHRPPARPQRSAIELDPANPAARHPVGVRTPRTGRVSRPVAGPRRGPGPAP